jgi:hypothetical protein
MAPHLLLYRKLLYAFLPPLFSLSPIMTLRYRMKPPRLAHPGPDATFPF